MGEIRVIEDRDIPRVLEIYKPSILATAASFELSVPSLSDFTNRVHKTVQTYPWLVFEEEGVVKGYAYAGAHRAREAYQWCVESSVYIDNKFSRQNIGRKLYTQLFTLLKQQSLVNVYAGITLPNDASIGFHKSFGFEEVGVYKKIGYKFDRWQDVAWYSLRLTEEINGQPPIAFAKIKERIQID